jgi:hypothetical protein
VINQKLDGRKVSALKFWGLVEDAAGKLTLSPRGRLVAADNGARRRGRFASPRGHTALRIGDCARRRAQRDDHAGVRHHRPLAA